jgi:hypothetical protein
VFQVSDGIEPVTGVSFCLAVAFALFAFWQLGRLL